MSPNNAIVKEVDSSVETITTAENTSVLDIKEMIQGESVKKGTKQCNPEQSFKRLISVGVPVPDSYKTTKPPLEKWSENNSLAELIYFENLPNSTGVFDKMRSVLGSVRAKLFSTSTEVTEIAEVADEVVESLVKPEDLPEATDCIQECDIITEATECVEIPAEKVEEVSERIDEVLDDRKVEENVVESIKVDTSETSSTITDPEVARTTPSSEVIVLTPE